jgi:hypothetical protein
MSNVNEILEKWYLTKTEITRLEKKVENYKNKINKIMVENHRDEIKGDDYTVSKTSITRHSLNKKNVPVEIYDKYKSKISYESFFVKKRK